MSTHQAMAADATDPANRARALYYYIVGPPAGGYPAGHTGPATGLFAKFNQLIFDTTVDTAFQAMNVTQCSDIPSTGFMSLPAHSLGSLNFEFLAARKTVPTFFTKNSGSNFQKGIRVLNGPTQIANLELNCPDSAGTVSGYMSTQDGTRNIEVFFQYEVNGLRRQIEVFSTDIGVNTEKFVARMETVNGRDYEMWSVKTSDDPSAESFGVAISGSTQTQRANIKTVKDTDTTPDNTVPVDEGILACVNLQNNQTDDTVSACPANIEDPVADSKGGDFSIKSTSDVVVTVAEQLLTDQNIYDFGDLPMSTLATQIIQITNSNAVDSAASVQALNLTGPFEFTGGTYPGTGGTCTTTLAAGASCLIEVSVMPFTAGEQFGFFELAYDITSAPVQSFVTTVAMRVNAVSTTSGALLVLSEADPFDFGSRAIGTSNQHTFTLSNIGSAQATNLTASGLTNPFSFAGGSFPGAGGTCGVVVAAGTSCTLVLEFIPIIANTYNATLTLSYSGNMTTLTRALQATAAATGFLEITDAGNVDAHFGSVTVGGSVIKSLTVTNLGGTSVTSLADSGGLTEFDYLGGAYPGTGGDCGITLAGGASCTLTMVFNPTSVGVKSELLTLNYNDGAVATSASIALMGDSTTPAVLALSDPNPYSFGGVATSLSANRIFTLANFGTATATAISEVGLAAPFAFTGGVFPGVGGTCTTLLAAGATCLLDIEYAPTTVGSFTDDIDISYNDGSTTVNFTHTLAGDSGTAVLTLSDVSYDFGSMSVGFSGQHVFVVSNTGLIDATAMTASGLAAPFNYVGGTFPGTGGTCIQTLAAGASCTIRVQFSPTVNGTFSDNLDINYNDGLNAQTVSASLVGTATSAAALQFAAANPYDFGSAGVGAVVNQTLTVTNAGSSAATLISDSGLTPPFSFTGGAFPGTGGTCVTSLAANASCTLAISFSPTAAGSFTDILTLSYNDGVTAQSSSIDFVGAAAGPALLTLSDTDPYDFGNVVIGTTQQHTFTMTNSGNTIASNIASTALTAPFAFKGGSYPGVGGSCFTNLAALDTCTLVVDVSPAAAGVLNDTLTLSYNDGVGSVSLTKSLTVTGVNSSVLTISDADPYDFGGVIVGATTTHIFTLTNAGTTAISSISVTGLSGDFSFTGGFYPGTSGTCGTTLAASSSCTIDVQFSPIAPSAITATMTVNYFNGSTFQTATRSLVGTGATPAVLTISEADPYNYGSVAVGSTTSHTFTVTNSGGVSATSMNGSGLAAPYTFTGGVFPGTGGTCSSTLAAGTTCTLVVEFAPTVAGVASDQIEINYNDGATAQLVSRGVTGGGVVLALLSISDGPIYDFGTVAVSATGIHTFTVSNIGSGTAVSMSASGLSAPFSFQGGAYPGTGGTCTTTLATSASCTVVVEFSPTVSGTFTAGLSMQYNDGSGAQVEVRDMTGATSAVASLSISESEPFNFGNHTIGSITTHTFTVTNSGSGVATTINEIGLAAPFTFAGGAFPGSSGTCTTNLASAASCDIEVEFSPTSLGTFNDTIEIAYNDGIAAQTATRGVTGQGVAPALLVISEANPYDYGSISMGSTQSHTFTITNTGGATATTLSGTGLAAPYLFQGGSYPGTGGTCSLTLVSSSSCTVVIDFSPTTTGTFTDTFEMNYNDGGSAQVANRDLTGLGI